MLEGLLIAQATGGIADDQIYQILRRKFMADPTLYDLIPVFVRTYRNMSAFWPFIKREAKTYAERREIIVKAFTPLMDYLEGRNSAPSDQIASNALETFDVEGVHAVWNKAIARRTTDPEGAITIARTLLETVTKRILDECGESYTDKEDLPKLYSYVAKILKLAPSQHTEEPIKAILGGATNLVNGIGTLRNRLSELSRSRRQIACQTISPSCQPCGQHRGSNCHLPRRNLPREATEIMRQSDVDEALAVLYLRLNGYFTTGLILHSPIHGQATTELDCVAIRMPHHQQTDRVVSDAPFLEIKPSLTDLIICEVKSNPELVSFNRPLKEERQTVEALLQWTGVHSKENIPHVAGKVQPLLQDDANLEEVRSGVTDEGVRTRALLCCPSSTASNSERWLLDGLEILSYANECFNHGVRRDTCSVRYNFQQWSYPLNRIVTWLKDQGRKTPTTINELYAHLGVA
ncbi:MAG: abortive infection family protein [Litoreibacter sp.]